MPPPSSTSIIARCQPIADCREAIAPDAPLVHSKKSSNVLVVHRTGLWRRRPGICDRSSTYSLWRSSSIAAGPIRLEGRAVVARYDALDDRMTVWSSTQMSHETRSVLVNMLGLGREPGPRRRT